LSSGPGRGSEGGRPARRWRRLGLYAAAAALVVVVLVPFLFVVQMSLKTEGEALRMPPQLIFRPTLQNYGDLVEHKFIRSLRNSAVTATATTALALLLGVPAAYALSRARLRSEGLISLWTLSTRMAPPIAFGIPFFLIYKSLGLIDTLVGLIVIYLTFNLSLVIWMMRAFFDGLPTSLEEAAYIDGAGTVGAFLRITLPLSAPGLATTAIFCFLFSWNDFFYSLILTRSEAVTSPVAIVNFMNYESWEWGKIAAGATMIMLPVVALSIVVRRYLVRGLTAGALKG
jgi:multiple sugar transport system permease protein